MNDVKPWWQSRCLWGCAIALLSIAAVIAGDSGLYELSADIRTQLLASNFLGLAVAGYGRVKASSKLS